MTLYVYTGDERVYPSVPVTVNDGDIVDWPDSTDPDGVAVASVPIDGHWVEYVADKKSKVAVIAIPPDNAGVLESVPVSAPVVADAVVDAAPPADTTS